MTTNVRRQPDPRAREQDAPVNRPGPDPDPDGDLLDKVVLATAARLDRIGERCRSEVDAAEGHMQRAMILAAGIVKLRQAITQEIMRLAKGLMNTDLGFQTDRGPGKKQTEPYPDEVVKDCLVSAAIHGLYWTGNEFNVLAGRCYVTQAGYDRKLRSVPGISDVVMAPGVPVLHQGRQVVRVALSWALDGVKDQLIGADGKPGLAFPITAYGKETADQLIGKAKRKALKAAFEKVTGSNHLLPPDGDAGEAPDGPAATRNEQVADRLGVNARDALQIERVRELAQGMEPSEFAALAESCGDPDPRKMTPSQRDALLLLLEAQGKEPDDAERQEREAIAAE